MIDRRFPTALQIMHSLVLAERSGIAVVSSSQFAEGLRANPALVRRLLGTLIQRGLLISHMGRNGGVRLACPAEEICLDKIYEASIDGKALWEGRKNLPHACIVSTNFEQYFRDLTASADKAVLHMLGEQTLADSFAALERIDGDRKLTTEETKPLQAVPDVAPIKCVRRGCT